MVGINRKPNEPRVNPTQTKAQRRSKHKKNHNRIAGREVEEVRRASASKERQPRGTTTAPCHAAMPGGSSSSIDPNVAGNAGSGRQQPACSSKARYAMACHAAKCRGGGGVRGHAAAATPARRVKYGRQQGREPRHRCRARRATPRATPAPELRRAREDREGRCRRALRCWEQPVGRTAQKTQRSVRGVAAARRHSRHSARTPRHAVTRATAARSVQHVPPSRREPSRLLLQRAQKAGSTNARARTACQ